MDRDARDQPTGAPEGGSDWSIEDFDDFSAFEDLDLGPEDAEQPTFDFADSEPEPGETSVTWEDPIPENGRAVDDPTDNANADPVDDDAVEPQPVSNTGAGEPEAGDPEIDTPEPDDESAPETPAPDGELMPEAPPPEEAAASAFPFDAPHEPEASMARSAPRHAPEPEGPSPEVFDVDDVLDFSDFTHEQYVKATTQEYAGLAEEVARAATQEQEQMAVAAGIPGLESGVVGLDDVLVGAEDSSLAPPSHAASDLSVRVLTAVALIALFFGSLFRGYLVATLIFVVMFVAAVEMYVVFTRVGHRPMTLFGLIGVGSALFSTYKYGPKAIPIALALTTVATLVFFGVVVHRKAPLLDAALTVLVLAWIGGLGSLAMDIAWAPDYAWMISAVVVITALMDVAQYFVGRRFGKRQLAPRISPKKTVEGLIGGIVVAIGIGAVFGNFGPFELTDGLVLGGIVALVAPFGDLAVSVVKRAIGVKDMSAILPGHGGVLDRIDAMLFVIPAAWVAYSWMGLIV